MKIKCIIAILLMQIVCAARVFAQHPELYAIQVVGNLQSTPENVAGTYISQEITQPCIDMFWEINPKPDNKKVSNWISLSQLYASTGDYKSASEALNTAEKLEPE